MSADVIVAVILVSLLGQRQIQQIIKKDIKLHKYPPVLLSHFVFLLDILGLARV